MHQRLSGNTVLLLLLGLQRRRICDGILGKRRSRRNCGIERIRLLRNASRLPGGVGRIEVGCLFQRAIIDRGDRIEEGKQEESGEVVKGYFRTSLPSFD